jgi:hypothetical protein
VVAQVLVDDTGPDVGHLGPLGELVDDEGVELLVVGYRDVEQEVLAAGDDERADGVREPGRPVAEGLDVASRRRPGAAALSEREPWRASPRRPYR